MVSVVGDAGIGKSRLLQESVGRLSGWLVVAAGGAPHAKDTPYSPIMEILKTVCGVAETDTAVEVQAKVARAWPSTAGDPDGSRLPCSICSGYCRPSMHSAPSSPRSAAQRTHAAVTELLLAASLTRPLCLIVEDLHWIDSETQAILDLLAESIAASRVLLLVNYPPSINTDGEAASPTARSGSIPWRQAAWRNYS